MARRTTNELAFTAIRIEGGLLAADFLDRVGHFGASEQSEADYDIPKGLKIRDEIGRSWKIARNLWQDFQAGRQRTDHDAHVFTVREFLEPFCRQVLGFADLRSVAPVMQGERVFPIGFRASGDRVPLVFAAHTQGLDRSDPRFGDGIRRRSPFLLAQEYLNAHEGVLWAIVGNGLKLRVLRDNPSLTRPAYIEVDLEALLTEEDRYPDFTAFWLLAHASRFGKSGNSPSDCPLERWRNGSQEAGIRARERLRVGVTEALRTLGSGFIGHARNSALRDKLNGGDLSKAALFEQLLRLVYRLIFLATVEDRTTESGTRLVFAPDALPEAMQRYELGYSLTRLRELAARRRGYDRHSDLWQALGIAFEGLGKGQPALGLPALGGLFAAESCPDLDAAHIENRFLLSAVFSLCFFREGAALSRVNYRDMDSEELGSVYESLLELVPVVEIAARRFAFVGDEQDEGSTKGNARKLTGSYYTPDSLVQELIKSALDPVIEQTLKDNPQQPAQALLSLTVCDPACGSGHFLLAAARRLAEALAKLRAPDGNPSQDDYRHALREVVGHCIYGVDKNPLAVELAKTALWLEAYTPDRPLNFLDHHLRCGDALLGVLDPRILEEGIPDKAFDPLSGDDKAVAKRLKAENRAALNSLKRIKSADLFAQADVRRAAETLEALPDETLTDIERKRTRWQAQAHRLRDALPARLADTYVAAFLMPKIPDHQSAIPLTGHLWALAHDENPGRVSDGVTRQAHDICRTHQVFHWWLEFPHIFTPSPSGEGVRAGGFSVLLGNPPWEVSQLGEEEYFSARAPSIAALSGDKRKRAIAGLAVEYPQLWAEYVSDKRGYEAVNAYFRESGRFPLTAVGKINTYALFAETFSQLVSPNGRAGFIVPTGIATDDSTKAFFEAVSQSSRLVSLVDIENRERLFPAVDSRMKFCLLTLGHAPVAEFVCFATRVDQVDDPRRRFTLSPEEFRLINPNTRTCPVFRSQMDAELTKKIYRAAPVLIRDTSGTESADA